MISRFFTLIAFILLGSRGFASTPFTYVYPIPETGYHIPQTTILLRCRGSFDETTLQNKNNIRLSGSKHGTYHWTYVIGGKNTLIIKPDQPFTPGETVLVTISSKLKQQDGTPLNGMSYSFSVRNEDASTRKGNQAVDDFTSALNPQQPKRAIHTLLDEENLDSLAAFRILTNSPGAWAGQSFYNNEYQINNGSTNDYLMIIGNNDSLYWARDQGNSGHDFKINHNGYLTYFNYPGNQWMELDSNYKIIDSLQAGNGYETYTNGHDLQIFPDGYAFVIAFQTITMDLTYLGGQPNAQVNQCLFQELDSNRNVIFQWRTIDHMDVTDTDPINCLTCGLVDPFHMNSLEPDSDGNIIVSFRNCDEFDKISLTDGSFIWRLNGKHNQFTFINDNLANHFSFQHDVRRIANGDITLFNNGNSLPTLQSSAKEYKIDEVNKTATLTWQYTHPTVNGNMIFGRGSGSVQRLPNGNTLIDWGAITAANKLPNFTEVDSAGNIVWEAEFADSNYTSYRIHKYDWDPCARVTSFLMNVSQIKSAQAFLSWEVANNAVKYTVEYKPDRSSQWSKKTTRANSLLLTGLMPSTVYDWRLQTNCASVSSNYTPVFSFKTKSALQKMSDGPDLFSAEVYPNPSSTGWNIQLKNESDGWYVIKNVMDEKMAAGFIDDDKIFISAQNYIPGIYFLTITSDGQHQTLQLVKH